MRVVNFNKSHYTLQDIVTEKLRNFHVTQLKAFKYDQMDIDPVEIARAEQNEFLVEKILEHRSDHIECRAPEPCCRCERQKVRIMVIGPHNGPELA